MVCPYAWDRPGGVQSHIRSLAAVLRRRGHEVEVFAPLSWRRRGDVAGAIDPEGPITPIGRAVGIAANGAVAPITFGPVAAVRIRRALARFEPDVVHLHEPLIPSLSLLALLSIEVPAVGTFHAAARSSLLYRICRPALIRVMDRLAARTAVSEAAGRLVARYFPGELLLTPNGVDVRRFAEAAPTERGGGPHVLFLGRLEPRKGADVLIRAMALLGDTRASLLVAGDGRLRSRLQALATDLGVAVRFLGAVSEDEKVRLLRSCDLYCAPNLGGESFGIVLVEAMAAGCPIVCSDLEEFKVVAGDAAIFSPVGRSAPLAEALRSVLSDPERARNMRKSSTARASIYDWSRLVTGVEAIYERSCAAAR
jgi:phosphatidyl-myo-inositol alpha-mannosyltransferase